MTGLIKLGYNIADRDCNNKTPRDIAQDCNIEENVQAIGKRFYTLLVMFLQVIKNYMTKIP